MSEYLSKKAVLEWLDQRASNLHWGARQADHHEIIDKIQSGAFDVQPEPEVQRLRAALEMAQSELRWGDPTNAIERVERIIDEALSTTTEQAERVRDKMKSLFEAWDLRGICKDSLEGYEQGVMLELIGLCEEIAGIKAAEGDGNDA